KTDSYVNQEIALARKRALGVRGSFLIPLRTADIDVEDRVAELSEYQEMSLRPAHFDQDLSKVVSTMLRDFQRRNREQDHERFRYPLSGRPAVLRRRPFPQNLFRSRTGGHSTQRPDSGQPHGRRLCAVRPRQVLALERGRSQLPLVILQDGRVLAW